MTGQSEMPPIEFVVNGEPVALSLPGTVPLLTVLRNDLGLVGTRAGCGNGQCGACTVLVDGAPTRSCDLSLEGAAGTRVTTSEGLGTPDSLHPVQQAFVDRRAAQCGYCINGIVMTVAGHLQGDAEDPERLMGALEEHICRCGTHVRILEAVHAAAGRPIPRRSAGRRTAPPETAPDDGLPDSVRRAPMIEEWIRLAVDGTIEIEAAKSEIGQGIHTAFGRIVAAQLGVDPQLVRVLPPETDRSPDEGFTSGSRSLMTTGLALAMAAVAFRRELVERAARRLGEAPGTLTLESDGHLRTAGAGTISLAELAEDGPITGTIETTDRPRWDAGGFSKPSPRADLPPKVSGAPAFVHDLRFPDTLHVRAVLPAASDTRLVEIDLDAGLRSPGVVEVLRDGSLVLVLAEREEQAVAAAERLASTARWEPGRIDDQGDPGAWLRSRPGEPYVAAEAPAEAAAPDGGRRLSATYTRPYHTHGPMAPSCSVARFDDDRLTVWSHTQGVHPLRAELAALLGLDPTGVDVIHGDGPGCYGMNGADDAAAFAAIAALSIPGRHVRFQHTLGDEFAWDPLGSAMAADLSAVLDSDGRIASWRMKGFTDVHSSRPRGRGDRLAPAWLRADGVPRPWTGPAETGARNAVPIYRIPSLDVVVDHVQGPLRTGPLRSLASFHNVFSIESFMDELAEAAGSDPVEFRRRHLTDPRALGVLDAAVDAAGWEPHVGPSGRGLGVGLARYKGAAAYAAVVVGVEVDAEAATVAVRRVWVACDAGTVVDEDGLRNQLEGGVVQGLSRVLHEEVAYGTNGIAGRDWDAYPVIRFSEIPEIHTVLVDRPGSPPLGAGEVSTPPTAGALANAVDDAIGLRLRAMPFTPERIRRRLFDMSAEEGERLLL